jgi:hypothetical protein
MLCPRRRHSLRSVCGFKVKCARANITPTLGNIRFVNFINLYSTVNDDEFLRIHAISEELHIVIGDLFFLYMPERTSQSMSVGILTPAPIFLVLWARTGFSHKLLLPYIGNVPVQTAVEAGRRKQLA